VRGKIEGLIVTRFMRDVESVLDMEAGVLIARFFPSHKGQR
jgi:regulator of RNase E activity RraA